MIRQQTRTSRLCERRQDAMDKATKAKVKRLLYLRKELDNIIENEITETVLREKELDIE